MTMLIEHRTYALYPGKMSAYFSTYIGEGLAIQLEYLSMPTGYYMTELGTLNQIIHSWGYDSLDDRMSRRACLKLDERWSAYVTDLG